MKAHKTHWWFCAPILFEVTMPDVTEYSDEQEWMSVCVPAKVGEGMDNEQAVAVCMSQWKEKKSIDPLVTSPNAVKAVKMDDGNVRLTGYLVRFSDETKTDLTGDFFAPDTDYGDAQKSEGWFNHRTPVTYNGKQFAYQEQLPDATLTRDEKGIIAEIILGARNEYERMIADWGVKGLLGWSSGTAPHLVDRVQVGNAQKITRWHLGLDASLTPTPAEPRNTVVPLKSISVLQVNDVEVGQDKPVTAQPENKSTKSKEVKKMEDKELSELLTNTAKQAAEEAVKSYVAATEEVKKAVPVVQVTVDEADRPFKSIAEQCAAVKAFTQSFGQKQHPRLKALKAIQGASEAVPTDGGLLLDPTLTSEFMQPMHEDGVFYNDVRKLPVGANSNSGWINGVDETSRATGSRWGGVRGYRLAEGDTFTKSKPKFRRIQWELKKYGVLVYGTDELLKDASQFSAVINQAAREELVFMINDDIMNGVGVSGALGVMNSGALITVTRDTGSAILGSDISAMWQRMSIRSKPKSKWYVNSECAPQLDKLFAVGSTAVLFPYAGYTPEGVRTLYGRPVVETEFNAALNTTGDIMLADMSEYLLWEKGGIESASSIHVEFLTDQEVFRFIYRADGQTAIASAITPYKGTNTQSPFVVLGSAT
jgi:HK97 family phage major capsid protein